MQASLLESNLSGLKLLNRGKVRDIYEVDDDHLLIVTTDRISAFDVILPTAIPGKGEILTEISNFWFKRSEDIISNHLTGIDPCSLINDQAECAALGKRAIVVKKLKPLPIEAIVRGYIVGSGWKDYQKSGAICGIKLESGYNLADKLPDPIYTPSTKADIGAHDENINFASTIDLLGEDLANQVKKVSLQLYKSARDYAAQRGIIIADTKFEFGLDEQDNLVLIDELLTPDSSRFWPISEYCVGKNPPSFDKQFVRDYLQGLDWDKTAPGPELPESIAQTTAKKYQDAAMLIQG